MLVKILKQSTANEKLSATGVTLKSKYIGFDLVFSFKGKKIASSIYNIQTNRKVTDYMFFFDKKLDTSCLTP